EKALNLAIGEPASFDAGRGANALDRRHPPQCRKPVRRQRAERAPCAPELIDPGNEDKNVRGDPKGVGRDHDTQYYAHLHPYTSAGNRPTPLFQEALKIAKV